MWYDLVIMENLHAQLNSLEKDRTNIKDRAQRFFCMIKAVENKFKTNRMNYEKKLKVHRKN